MWWWHQDQGLGRKAHLKPTFQDCGDNAQAASKVNRGFHTKKQRNFNASAGAGTYGQPARLLAENASEKSASAELEKF